MSTRDLMNRMGHDSMHAALMYQHATSEVDEAIAVALNERLRRLRPSGITSEPGDDEAV